MNDLVEGCRIEGNLRLDGKDIFKDMDVNLLRKRVGMVFQKPNPFPMSIYDNIAFGPRTHGIHSKSKLDDIVEKSLRDAAIWEECKDRLIDFNNVDFPQPDGPINAVILFSSISRFTFFNA